MTRGLVTPLLLLIGIGACALCACVSPEGASPATPPALVDPDRAGQLQEARTEALGQLAELRSRLAAVRAGQDSLARMVGRMNSSLDSVVAWVEAEQVEVPRAAFFDLRLRGDALLEGSVEVLERVVEAEGKLDAFESLLLDRLDRLESAPAQDPRTPTELGKLLAATRALSELVDPVLAESDALVLSGSQLAADTATHQDDVRRRLSIEQPMPMKTILRDPANDVEVSRAPGGVAASAAASAAAAWQSDQVAEIVTSEGSIVVEFLAQDAPRHVENFVELVRDDFYDDMVVHRVVPDFVVQAGCPIGDGSGGPGWQIANEFNERSHVRGTLSMARMAHPDSAGSQFFFALKELPALDNKYTVFGRMVAGESTLAKIEDLGSLDGKTTEPVLIRDIVLRERRAGEGGGSK